MVLQRWLRKSLGVFSVSFPVACETRSLPIGSGAQLYTKKWWLQGSGTYGESVEREPITGVWGQSPQRGPGAEPLREAKPPWSWKVLAKQRQNLYIHFPHLLHICKGMVSYLANKNKFAREKVVVTITTTFKSDGDMSPPSHTKLRLCIG